MATKFIQVMKVVASTHIYFTLRDELVIVITRPYSPEMQKRMLLDDLYYKYISIEGVILPEEADIIFDGILK